MVFISSVYYNTYGERVRILYPLLDFDRPWGTVRSAVFFGGAALAGVFGGALPRPPFTID